MGHDFGSARAGDVVTHRFMIANPTGRTLTLRKPRASCGCVAKIDSARTIFPGSSGEVAVSLDTTGRSGPTAAAVQIATDDPERGDLTLLLHGRVIADATASPPQIYLGRIAPNRSASARVEIQLAPGVEIRSARSEDGWVSIRTQPLPAPKHGTRLDLTLNPIGMRGRVNDRVVVATTSTRQPELSVPVYASIE